MVIVENNTIIYGLAEDHHMLYPAQSDFLGEKADGNVDHSLWL